MNREILFKAKRKNNGEWVEGYYVPHIVEGKIVHHFILTGEADLVETEDDELILKFYWEEIDPNTLCQYTGLTDKNGKKILENDLLGHKLNRVEFMDGAYCVNGDRSLYFMAKENKVIGNIFDNADLLEVE